MDDRSTILKIGSHRVFLAIKMHKAIKKGKRICHVFR